MKSQSRIRKRKETRNQELSHQLEIQKRLWDAALAGDVMACEFLSKQYLGRGVDLKSHDPTSFAAGSR